MPLLVTERSLRDRRRGFLGWSIGLAAYVVLQSSFYPSVHSSDFQKAIASYPKELKAFFGGVQGFDISTGRGYLEIELFSLIVPGLLTIAAIAYGVAAIAGERERGTLDLVLANPISRSRVILEKVLGEVDTVFGLAAVVAIAVMVCNEIFDLEVGLGNLLAACFLSALVAVLFGLLAMLAGAASGSRAVSIGVPAALFAASYLLVGLSGLVDWLERYRVLSPLYHATGTHPLAEGLPIANTLVLLGLALAVLAALLAAFDRRDIVR